MATTQGFFYDGQQWRELILPEKAGRIVNIHIESDTHIWLCGAKGTLLLGNASEGFRSLSPANDNQLFTSVCEFQGKMYLASNLGLFVYDPEAPERGIKQVVTHLKPDLQDVNIVDCCGKVLWSIGPKDVARFGGVYEEQVSAAAIHRRV